MRHEIWVKGVGRYGHIAPQPYWDEGIGRVKRYWFKKNADAYIGGRQAYHDGISKLLGQERSSEWYVVDRRSKTVLD